MRPTRETLLKLAQETVNERVSKNRQILAVYLCGSLLEAEHLLGGATDIDLFFVHLDEPPIRREIQHLTEEVHLDIAHLNQAEYRHPRQLRVHPWMGPALNNSRVLYDPQHFMDFTIAGVRGQFDRPDHVHQRINQTLESARRILDDLQEIKGQPAIEDVLKYLRGVSHTAQTLAGLSGPPLTERRFLLAFPQRSDALKRPGLYAGLQGLLGAPWLDTARLAVWIGDWQAAFQELSNRGGSQSTVPARLHPVRQNYYLRGFVSMLGSPQPENTLWPLLHTWSLAIRVLGEESAHYQKWLEAFTHLNLAGGGFADRLAALKAYFDTAEDVVADWTVQNGLE